jgi:hypothetical protein
MRFLTDTQYRAIIREAVEAEQDRVVFILTRHLHHDRAALTRIIKDLLNPLDQPRPSGVLIASVLPDTDRA